jgi:hypothetical protein
VGWNGPIPPWQDHINRHLDEMALHPHPTYTFHTCTYRASAYSFSRWAKVLWTFILVSLSLLPLPVAGSLGSLLNILTWKYNNMEVNRIWNYPYIFSGSCIPTNESLFILLAVPTLSKTVVNIFKIINCSPIVIRGKMHYYYIKVHVICMYIFR